MPKIIVVGSISTDFVVEANKQPEIGETIEGNQFHTNFGGKGANQAIACARLGADVHMLGAVGEDDFGRRLLDNLSHNDIAIDGVETIADQPSGSAFITIVDGDNSIIYIAGANGQYTAEMLSENLEKFKNSDMVLVQNETPESTVETIITLCAELGIPVLYNPAPARKISSDLIEKVTFLTPNETEFKELFPDKDIEEVLKKYPNKLIITLGSKGAIFYNGHTIDTISAEKVEKVVDTTGAGDTFNGAFAVAYTSGQSIVESIRFANQAAALSIQKTGAQNGMPTVKNMQRKYKKS